MFEEAVHLSFCGGHCTVLSEGMQHGFVVRKIIFVFRVAVGEVMRVVIKIPGKRSGNKDARNDSNQVIQRSVGRE